MSAAFDLHEKRFENVWMREMRKGAFKCSLFHLQMLDNSHKFITHY